MNRSEAGKKGYEKTKEILKHRAEEKSQRVREDYEAHPKYCPYCGEKIPFERRFAKFCNSSCAASFNNRGLARNSDGVNGLPRDREIYYCACGNVRSRINKYCPECIDKRIFNRPQSLEDAGDARSRKRILLEQRGHRCEVCGLSEWVGKPIPIEMDHIDGNADHNTADNLRLICPNCHAQTATYKGANAGKGSQRQLIRRKRYAEGKTY